MARRIARPGTRKPKPKEVQKSLLPELRGFSSAGNQQGARDVLPASGIRMFDPVLQILPPNQFHLWSLLRPVRDEGFVLYGGTAIALRLGHRSSVDFDFFSDRRFDHASLLAHLPFAAHARVLQEEPNAITLLVKLPGFEDPGVKVSFFGGISFGRTGVPEITRDRVLMAASMLDLLGTKLKVIQQRADKKDYLDIHAMLQGGLALEEGLAAARLLYGRAFQPSEALKALTYYSDGNLREVPNAVRAALIEAASRVERIPDLHLASRRLDLEEADG